MAGEPTRKRGNWSTHELERLKTLYPRSPDEQVARVLRRTVDSVRRKARELFSRPSRRGAWAADEDRMLRECWGAHEPRTVAMVLGRPEPDVRERAEALREQRRRGGWTPAEEQLLKRLYGSRADADLEVCLSRSQQQIQRAAARLCLSKDKRVDGRRASARRRHRSQSMPRWSEADIRLLESLYADLDNLEIARRLGRSVVSVANKAHQLGLRKSSAALTQMGRRNVSARHQKR